MLKLTRIMSDVEFTEKDYDFFNQRCAFTQREKTILDLSRKGWSNQHIAVKMGWSLSTVDRDIRKIKKKIKRAIILG